MKRALIIGAGVAGCAASFLLQRKGYGVTMLEKDDVVGGLSRTYYYNGHPYEFGPHIWFWPKDRENNLMEEMHRGDIFDLTVNLHTFTGSSICRYPIHLDDVMVMPERDQILSEWKEVRDEQYQLIASRLPHYGKCSYEAYFKTALGPTLYDKFMKEYTYKMWGVPGDELGTTLSSLADKLKNDTMGLTYDPIKFVDQYHLGDGMPCWYPKKGWNPIWEGFAAGANVVFNVGGIVLSRTGLYFRCGGADVILHPSDYDVVICTIHADTLLGECKLPTNGRLVVPFYIPGLQKAFPENIQTIHYSDNSAITRALEFKAFTRHESPDTLITLEIPIIGGDQPVFPANVEIPRHVNKRCYPVQNEEAFALHGQYVNRAHDISGNIHFCGRDANFQYWNMPLVVENVMSTIEELK